MWDFFEPQDRQWYRWSLAGAEAYLRKNGDEWRVAFHPIPYDTIRSNSIGPEVVKEPELPEVSFVVGRGRRAALRPRLSELPYLVVARDNVRILPGAESRFQVTLPPLVRFELEGGDVLGEIMPFELSNTWFGDTSVGTLCRSLPTALDPRCHGELEESLVPPGADSREGGVSFQGGQKGNGALVQCEIIVRNSSRSYVDLKQLAIYTDLLSLYLHGGLLYSDRVLVDSQADGGLRMGVDKAIHQGKNKLATGNKEGLSELFIRRGVKFLKTVTSM